MKTANLKNTGYLTVLALLISTLVFFQNCSNYSASLKSEEAISPSNDNLQLIAENSPALNDSAPNDLVPSNSVPNETVPIQIDHVIPSEDDLMPDEMSSIPDQDEITNLPSEVSVQNVHNNNEVQDNSNDMADENDKACHNKSRKNCEYRNRCNLLAEAGVALKGFNVITLTQADEGKTFSSHGKTIYSYSGSSSLHIESIKSSGKTVICGNISITNLQSNGNCHLFYTQVEQANINGNITTSELDENGFENVMESKSGRDVKSCKVDANALIIPL